MGQRPRRRAATTDFLLLAPIVLSAVVVLAVLASSIARAQSPGAVSRAAQLTPNGQIDPEEPPGGPPAPNATEAPAGFDNQTNGATAQGTFDANRAVFDQVEQVSDGLGPTYNAQSCRECHQNVVSGGASQVPELRAGRVEGGTFFPSLGGTLIEARATNPEFVDHTGANDNVRTLRISTNTLGEGFVESIANGALLRIRDQEPASVQGTADIVPVLEANSAARIGRFGWKSQHASLVSFAADAYLNEMGITNPLFPTENTSNGRDVSSIDPKADPEDDGTDVHAFADFIRSTKAPSRGPITADVQAGDAVFNRIGCATCHTASITTARPGTPVDGGAFVVPPELGNKVIHPYSDFLLHDIGTGDGIPVQPTAQFAATASQIRTAPLWALRTRNRLMHDGLSMTLQDAINRHAGQAAVARSAFQALSAGDLSALIAFLNSL